jgi:hypothetical protein
MAKKISERKKGFAQGYMCVVSQLVYLGYEEEALQLFKANFMSIGEMIEYEVDQHDIDMLSEVAKKAAGKREALHIESTK